MNCNFIRYATGTVFAIQLSKAQVRTLVGLSVPEDRLVALLNLPHHTTPGALIRKGLIEYQGDKVVLTDPGKLVLKLLDEAGLVPKGRVKFKLDDLIEELEVIKSVKGKKGSVKEKKDITVIHYNDDGRPACKMSRGVRIVTDAPLRVTCKICKGTKTYRDMVDTG